MVVRTIPSPTTGEDKLSIIWTWGYLSEKYSETNMSIILAIWVKALESITHSHLEEAVHVSLLNEDAWVAALVPAKVDWRHGSLLKLTYRIWFMGEDVEGLIGFVIDVVPVNLEGPIEESLVIAMPMLFSHTSPNNN